MTTSKQAASSRRENPLGLASLILGAAAGVCAAVLLVTVSLPMLAQGSNVSQVTASWIRIFVWISTALALVGLGPGIASLFWPEGRWRLSGIIGVVLNTFSIALIAFVTSVTSVF
jgi:hypothetical protein